jgi:hypothetical protein
MIELRGFSVSPIKFKKYRAYLSDGSHIDFGDKRYQHYKDKALGFYSDLDHNDEDRRRRYYQRHKKNYPKYSADWFSKKYLW